MVKQSSSDVLLYDVLINHKHHEFLIRIDLAIRADELACWYRDDGCS